jgi:putative PIN family toxin of toxin-antitoxin system
VRIVFDTNVLFAAFVAHGVCAGLYEECLLGGQIVVSQVILEELRDKLHTKAGLSRAEANEVVAAVAADADVVAVPRLSKPICRDPDDDWILATALAANVDALVTGDKDLLVLGRLEDIPILSPRDCLAFLRRR